MTARDSITRARARTPGAEDYPTSTAAHNRASLPTQCGISEVASTCAKGRYKPNISRCMPGAGLSRPMRGKVLPYMPAFQPYRGKPAVRNDREGRGNVGIIRSPVRASTLPDCGGRAMKRTSLPLHPPRARTLCEGGIDHELNVRFLLAGPLASAAAPTPVTETAAATESKITILYGRSATMQR
jgi:hypothetical protein